MKVTGMRTRRTTTEEMTQGKQICLMGRAMTSSEAYEKRWTS